MNMDAPVKKCTLEEQRAVIRFLWSEGEKPTEIHDKMTKQYGDSCMNLKNVYKWVNRFK